MAIFDYKCILKIALILILLIASPSQAYRRNAPVFAIEIFRHGARGSLLINTNADITPFGQVQQYIIGRELRTRYVDEYGLLSDQFNPKEMHILTSIKTRCIDSVKWQLTGFYPSNDTKPENQATPLNEEIIRRKVFVTGMENEIPPLDLHQSSIPKVDVLYMGSEAIQYVEEAGPTLDFDYYFHGYEVCKKAERIMDEALQGERLKELNIKYKDAWERGANIINSHVKYMYDPEQPNIAKIGKILDYYISNAYNGVEIKEYTPDLVAALKHAKFEYLTEVKFKDSFVRKSAVSVLFEEIREVLVNKYQGKRERKILKMYENLDIEEVKFLMYSCHDRNIFMTLLNLLTQDEFDALGESGVYQPYSSQIIIELWPQDASPEYLVTMKYDDKPLQMNKCNRKHREGKCTLNNFIHVLENHILEEITEQCN